ncbi:nucleoside hydrolase [Rossellomorea yichunensis]|uniref:nucleoside hydrolase n=1 Tax=Rossellomorea yichunensis TaxID=3077331 RepID=UPI0028DF38ED|nr:nucleoside hydrolase [Rossellomorea sp. YC4-1]MDT9026668.1 nucleoside hydrolase [Rossellomorea sp. YC4-1]
MISIKKIILFSDTGIDDAIALIYALKDPNIEVVGIVSGFGNTDRNKSYRNATYLLKLAGQKGIPVIAGSTRPLNGEEPEFFPDIHGVEGLGPLSPPIPEERYGNKTNFSKLFQLIKKNPAELTIVGVGRCTSLAIAWLLSPDVMSLVKETYIMGGAFFVPGNVTKVAEANFYGDAVAADIVCRNAPNLTVIPLNVTRLALITPAQVNFIHSRAKTPLDQIIKPILDFYYEAYQQLEPGIAGTPQHDLSAVMAAAAIDGLFTYEKRVIRVQHEENYANGLSIADFRPGSTDCFGTGCSRIAVAIDEDVFLSNVLDILTR